MPKKPSTPLRPQDAMIRFDRLLAAMAPKAGTVTNAPAKSIRKPKRRAKGARNDD